MMVMFGPLSTFEGGLHTSQILYKMFEKQYFYGPAPFPKDIQTDKRTDTHTIEMRGWRGRK